MTNMAWQLSSEVTAYLAAGGRGETPAERVVLYAIAERADVTGRRAWDGDGWSLAAVVGVDRIRKVLDRLEARGLRVRVAVGRDSRGRLMYAHRGRSVTYCLPVLSPIGAAETAPIGPSCAPPYGQPDFGAPSGAPSAYGQPDFGAPSGAPSAPEGAPSAPEGAPLSSLTVLNRPYNPPARTDEPSKITMNDVKEGGEASPINPTPKAHRQVADDLVAELLVLPGIPPVTKAGSDRMRAACEAALSRGITLDQIADACVPALPPTVHDAAALLCARIGRLETVLERQERARPPWCGSCDEQTRIADDGEQVYRCPTCHPSCLAV